MSSATVIGLMSYALIGLLLLISGPLKELVSLEIARTRRNLLLGDVSESTPVRDSLILLSRAMWSFTIILLWPFLLPFAAQESARLRLDLSNLKQHEFMNDPAVVWFAAVSSVREYLLCFWNPDHPPLLGRETGEWTLGLTPAFRKSIAKLDKNQQGGLLDALGRIYDAPGKRNSDKHTPQEGDHRRILEYAICNCRLIYRVDEATRHILILDLERHPDHYVRIGG